MCGACVRACVDACVRTCLYQKGDTPVEKYNNRATPHILRRHICTVGPNRRRIIRQCFSYTANS